MKLKTITRKDEASPFRVNILRMDEMSGWGAYRSYNLNGFWVDLYGNGKASDNISIPLYRQLFAAANFHFLGGFHTQYIPIMFLFAAEHADHQFEIFAQRIRINPTEVHFGVI